MTNIIKGKPFYPDVAAAPAQETGTPRTELVANADVASLLDWLEGRASGDRTLTRGEAATAIRILERELTAAREELLDSRSKLALAAENEAGLTELLRTAESRLRECRAWIALHYQGIDKPPLPEIIQMIDAAIGEGKATSGRTEG